jgi:ABC-2 type transport system ATP-binding protein
VGNDGSPLLAVSATGLRRSYDDVLAVDGLDLSIQPGELFALLGPNGSGKTTTIGMLCCLLRPDAGSAQVLGRDVAADPLGVKAVISVVPQETAVAEHLTGSENLRLMAGLHGVPTDRAKARSAELLEVLGLSQRASQQARKYSGGLKRRLSIAMALVSDPDVLFLDEPTLGLDPQARRGLWEHIASLKGTMTILLTTHYLEEADALADRVAIMDSGRIVAEGTPAELKAGVSSGPVTAVTCGELPAPALAQLQTVYPRAVAVDGGAEIPGDGVDFVRVQQLLSRHGVTVDAIGRKQQSLDDVFLALTGKQWRA